MLNVLKKEQDSKHKNHSTKFGENEKELNRDHKHEYVLFSSVKRALNPIVF